MKSATLNLTKRKLGALLLLGASILGSSTYAQSASDLKINEILIHNDSNYVDDFGNRSAWIEIFNSAYNSVNMGGLYLTNDLSNPTMYLIPKGYSVTSITQRGYLMFWADGASDKGILHLNFKLADSKIVALFDTDGKTLLDSMTLPLNAKKDVSYGLTNDGEGLAQFLSKSTPKNTNNVKSEASSSEMFKTLDPYGVAMTIIAMIVVFTTLFLLYFFFKYFGKIINYKSKPVEKEVNDDAEISGEITAAISLALYLYREQLHDQEHTVLTINKVAKAYSPWSSKIYGLRRWPRS